MTEVFTVDWEVEVNPTRQDAVWFYGQNYLATASLKTESGEVFSLDIYCDGETLYRIPYDDSDTDNTQAVRYPDEWESVGVTTDEQLNSLYDKWQECGLDIHVFNSWFDMYVELDGVSQHIDAVCHTVDDANSLAESVLREVAAAGGWTAWFDNA